MTSRANVLERFNILQRTNSFLISNSFKPLSGVEGLCNNFISNLNFVTCHFIAENQVAPITIAHLDNLYHTTIYLSDGPFNLIDFILNSKENLTIKSWIETKLTLTADQIESDCRISVQIPTTSFIEKWINRQPQGKPVDSDLLALRIMETLVLLAIANFHLFNENSDVKVFKELEDKLMDWSEAIGLIRSLSDNQFTLAAEASMDIDFNPSADSSQMSTIYNLKPKDFDVYLLEKFKNCKRIKEIIEIVAERCGIPVESDLEDEKKPNIPTDKPQTKHWRRVKPATLPIKRVASAKVNRPSSLSVSEVKSNRFLSTTSTRQVDVTIKPQIESNNSNETSRRRHSEASAPQIIQQTTPTKSKKTFLSNAVITNTNNNSNLSDSFVILETPPRVLSTKHAPLNDLTGSVRRLFPQQSMEE